MILLKTTGLNDTDQYAFVPFCLKLINYLFLKIIFLKDFGLVLFSLTIMWSVYWKTCNSLSIWCEQKFEGRVSVTIISCSFPNLMGWNESVNEHFHGFTLPRCMIYTLSWLKNYPKYNDRVLCCKLSKKGLSSHCKKKIPSRNNWKKTLIQDVFAWIMP